MPTVTLIQLVRLQIALSTTSLQIVLSTKVVNTATKLSFEISALLTTDSRARTTFQNKFRTRVTFLLPGLLFCTKELS